MSDCSRAAFKVPEKTEWIEYIYEVSPGAMRRIEPIVRCRNCKYFNESGECENDIWDVAYGEGYPYVAGAGDGNGFCAWAEKVN